MAGTGYPATSNTAAGFQESGKYLGSLMAEPAKYLSGLAAEQGGSAGGGMETKAGNNNIHGFDQ